MQPPAWYEREYSPRVSVPDATRYTEQWREASEVARATLTGHVDLAYGDGLNETLDLFPAPGSRTLHIFIHGGYWRAFDKRDFAWIAPPFVAAGVSVATLNYALCPAVTLATIIAQCCRAIAWLHRHAPTYGVSVEHIVISGHSAGGHLTACLWATDWAAYNVPTKHIAGGVALSGLYDLAPLLHTTINNDIRLDRATAAALSPVGMQPLVRAPLIIGVGAQESSEFVRQSQLLCDTWPTVCVGPLLLAECHHFNILSPLADLSSAIWQTGYVGLG